MTTEEPFKTYGVFVPETVYTTLADHLADEAGVVDFDDYFDPTTATVPRGDPAAEITHEFSKRVKDEFASLYDVADFHAARQVAPDNFQLVTLAATPAVVLRLKELFRAASEIQNSDLRTVHTAILLAAIVELTLPPLPEDTVTFAESSDDD